MYSCEPIAEAFDVIYLGDGEVNLETCQNHKRNEGMRREERLKEL